LLDSAAALDKMAQLFPHFRLGTKKVYLSVVPHVVDGSREASFSREAVAPPPRAILDGD
jgi:hypothetical protein